MSATPRPPLYGELDYLGGAAVYADEVFEVISQGAMFEGFSRHEIDALCRYMHCFAAAADTVLLNEGDVGDHQVILLSGEVEVCKLDAAGQPVSIARIGPGSILGEMSLVDGDLRFATCTTIAPVDFAVMTRNDLNEILITYPRLANKLLIQMLHVMVGRLRDTSMRLVSSRHCVPLMV